MYPCVCPLHALILTYFYKYFINVRAVCTIGRNNFFDYPYMPGTSLQALIIFSTLGVSKVHFRIWKCCPSSPLNFESYAFCCVMIGTGCSFDNEFDMSPSVAFSYVGSMIFCTMKCIKWILWL